MNPYTFLEIAGTVASLFFCYLLIKENIWCWLFGIIASFISIFLFVHSTLYAEAILAVYYVVIGFYGWAVWKRDKNIQLFISEWTLKGNLLAISISAILSFILGSILSTYTNATNPYTDAVVTIFSFLASYQEAKKILSGWMFWIAINAASIMLYFQRSLYYYAALAMVYTLMSIWGYYNWKKKYIDQKTTF